MVTATTLLLKQDAQVHNWASKGTSLGGQACLSSWLFSLLRCKMSLILPKCLYGVTTLSINFVIELLDSSGHDAVMTVMDSVSKRVHFVPMYTTVTVKGAVRLFLHYVWKLHGLLKHIVSNCRPSLWLHSLRNCIGY